MTKAHDSIAQGLKEAIELSRGEEVAARKHKHLTETDVVIQEENAAQAAGDHKGHPYN
jgi:hypothetical protein